jgi:hypothetical protein
MKKVMNSRTTNTTGREEFTLLLDTDPVDGVSGRIDWYCVNDLPALYNDGGTGDYSVLVSLTFNDSTSNGYTARLGDCVIRNYMLDSLSYTPGLIPLVTSQIHMLNCIPVGVVYHIQVINYPLYGVSKVLQLIKPD